MPGSPDFSNVSNKGFYAYKLEMIEVHIRPDGYPSLHYNGSMIYFNDFIRGLGDLEKSETAGNSEIQLSASNVFSGSFSVHLYTQNVTVAACHVLTRLGSVGPVAYGYESWFNTQSFGGKFGPIIQLATKDSIYHASAQIDLANKIIKVQTGASTYADVDISDYLSPIANMWNYYKLLVDFRTQCYIGVFINDTFINLHEHFVYKQSAITTPHHYIYYSLNGTTDGDGDVYLNSILVTANENDL